MTNGKYIYFFVKEKKGGLLKFSYDRKLGIYYKILRGEKWSEEKGVYKDSFEYFYVLEDERGIINLFCQDISGDIILCKLENEKWTYKTILYIIDTIKRLELIKSIYFSKILK